MSDQKPDTEKKRLWILNHYAATKSQAGGSRHLDLALALEKYDWTSEIFACSYDHVSRAYTVNTSWFRPVVTRNENGVVFHWIHSVPYLDNSWRRYVNMMIFSMILLIYCLFMRPRPQAVFGSSAHLLTPLVGWMVARRYRAKCIVEVRDLWPDSLIQLGLESRLVVTILRWLEKFLYRHSDILVGISQGIVDGIVRNGGDPEKTILISHGIEPNPTRKEVIAHRSALRRELGWGIEFVVLWAGSLEPFNALDTVIEAAKQLTDRPVKVVLLGGGSDSTRLKELAQDVPNLAIYPAVPRERAFEWMVAADAGILVAKPFEAFTGARPRKIFDYMAAALPILCFVPGEASEVIREAEAGLVNDWANSTNISDAIEWGLSHRNELRKMGLNGASAVETTYSISEAAGIFESVLTNGPSNDPKV